MEIKSWENEKHQTILMVWYLYPSDQFLLLRWPEREKRWFKITKIVHRHSICHNFSWNKSSLICIMNLLLVSDWWCLWINRHYICQMLFIFKLSLVCPISQMLLLAPPCTHLPSMQCMSTLDWEWAYWIYSCLIFTWCITLCIDIC